MSVAIAELEIPSRREQLRVSVKSWLPWVGKGSLAILDQGLISGSNFLIGILLARWLAPGAYGAYALAFAVFILLSSIYQALILEPMSVFGPSEYRNCQREYFSHLLWIHGGLVLPIAVILAAAAWAVHVAAASSGLAGALAGVAWAAPCVLLYWLARGTFYVRLEPHVAVGGAVLYCILLLGGLLVFYQRGLLSPFSAFLLMGTGALVVGGFQLFRLRPALRPWLGNLGLTAVGRRHWGYGRWALSSSLAAWIPWNVQYVLVGGAAGMAGAGALRALLNLTLPVMQCSGALCLLAQPFASGEGIGGIGKVTRRITLLFACIAVVYWALVTAFRRQIVSFLYAGNYGEVAHLVPWIALASVLTIVAYGPAVGLRAMQSPASVFVASGASSAIALAVGIPATRAYGMRGAILSIVLSSAAALPVELALLRQRLRGGARG